MMNTQTTDKQPLIRAAGGLLWRRTGNGYEIAVVHRCRYDDWTLPKGKLNAGETWLEAAQREIREETGYRAEITGFAGAIAYTTGKGLKVVRFWHMRPDGDPVQALDEEVAEVVWLMVEAARAKIQYPLEQALLDVWQTPEEVST